MRPNITKYHNTLFYLDFGMKIVKVYNVVISCVKKGLARNTIEDIRCSQCSGLAVTEMYDLEMRRKLV